MALAKLLWLPSSIKVIKEVLYRHAHRGTSSRGLLCEDSPSRSPLLHCLRVLIKDHELLQWPPQLPTLKTLRLMTRGFSFSLCLGSRLTPCSVFSLPSQFLPTLYLTLFSLSHQLITAVSLLCPRVMPSRHRGRFLSRLLCLHLILFFLFPLPGPFPGMEPLPPRKDNNRSASMPFPSVTLCFFE